MAKSGIQTGAHSTLIFYWEDNGFKQDPNDSEPKAFGKDATLNTLQGSRNAVELFDPGSREVAEYIEQQFSGTFSVEFVLSIGNPWWNEAIIDTPTTSGSDAPYTHTWDGEDPSSMRIVTGNTRSGEEFYLAGAYVENASININVPGNITVSLDGAYSRLEQNTPTELEQQVSDDAQAATFAHADIQLGGSGRRLVQSLGITISNNTDPVLEIGSEEPVDFSPKQRTLTVDHTTTRDGSDDEDISRFLGGAGETDSGAADRNDIVVSAHNGESGADREYLEYAFTDSMPNDFSVSNTGDPDSDIENDVTDQPTGVVAEAENPTQTPL